MPVDSAQIALERVLAAVGQCLDRQSAESLLRLRADTEHFERNGVLIVGRTALGRATVGGDRQPDAESPIFSRAPHMGRYSLG
jgi:hypothetical protein